MAVQLKEDGRYPASQQIPADQFARFVEACRNPPEPSPKLMELVRQAAQRKVVCR